MLLVEKKHGPVEVSRARVQCLGINFLFKKGESPHYGKEGD